MPDIWPNSSTILHVISIVLQLVRQSMPPNSVHNPSYAHVNTPEAPCENQLMMQHVWRNNQCLSNPLAQYPFPLMCVPLQLHYPRVFHPLEFLSKCFLCT